MKKTYSILLACFCLINAQYPTYDGCAELTDADFREVRLFSLLDGDDTMHEPMRMDFYVDEGNNVNIYWVERVNGRLKYYDAALDEVKHVGTLNVWAATETGLLGIALEPGFNMNDKNFVYLFYMPESPNVYRIGRWEINPDNTLNEGSEKVILDVPDTRVGLPVHTGGGMQFDTHGNLWITMGEHDHEGPQPYRYHNHDNKEESNEDCSSDTKSLYGAILRIHPEPDGSYTIPQGNFGDYWSAKFAAEGRTTLSNQYKDPNVVSPELYAKGFRNPMSVQVDPVTGWAAVSECGAQCHKEEMDAHWCPEHRKPEKHMMVTEPSFHGWSYFHADNHPYAENADLEKDPMKPVNNSPFHLGADTLPPAVPATYHYGLPDEIKMKGGDPWICSVGGFMYRYDGTNPSSIKFPPHFDGIFLINDLNQSFIRGVKMDDQGRQTWASDDLFVSKMMISHTMDLRQGPDGAMYMLNYGKFQYETDETTGIYRMEYNPVGEPCHPIDIKRPGFKSQGPVFDSRGYINLEGAYTAEVFGINGQKVSTFRGEGKQKIPTKNFAGPGVYQVKIKANGKTHTSLYTNL